MFYVSHISFPRNDTLKLERNLVFWCGVLLEAVRLLFLDSIVRALPTIARAVVARRATGL